MKYINFRGNDRISLVWSIGGIIFRDSNNNIIKQRNCTYIHDVVCDILSIPRITTMNMTKEEYLNLKFKICLIL